MRSAACTVFDGEVQACMQMFVSMFHKHSRSEVILRQMGILTGHQCAYKPLTSLPDLKLRGGMDQIFY